MSENLLQIKNLSIEFRTFDGVVKAINNLNLELPKGKTIGLVGETGAGTTTTALAIMGLIPNPPGVITSGEILFEGKDLLKAGKKELQEYRGDKIAMIFQNPMTSLNPVYTVGHQIAGVIMQHQNLSKSEAMEKAGEMLAPFEGKGINEYDDMIKVLYDMYLKAGCTSREALENIASTEPYIYSPEKIVLFCEKEGIPYE